MLNLDKLNKRYSNINKRYFKIDDGEQYFIFDSSIIKEEDVIEEKDLKQALPNAEVLNRLNLYDDKYQMYRTEVLRLEKEKERLREELKEIQQKIGDMIK